VTINFLSPTNLLFSLILSLHVVVSMDQERSDSQDLEKLLQEQNDVIRALTVARDEARANADASESQISTISKVSILQ
jgi:hypothetical protein